MYPAGDSKCSVSSGGSGFAGAFAPDRRWLPYSALMTLFFYWTAWRCASQVGDWSCGDAASCPSDVEWIVSAASAAQAIVSMATAAMHRQSNTARLLNLAHDVLSRSADERAARRRGRQRHAFAVAGAYGTVAAMVVLVRSVAVVAARPNRFSAVDVLLLCLPASVVPIVVECAIVCMFVAAEDTCHDVVHRLRRMAVDDTRPPSEGRPRGRRPLHWQLEAVWRDHWRGCRLVDGLSACYGLDLAVNMTVSMLFFVVYAYVTLMSVYAAYVHAAATDHNHDDGGTEARDHPAGVIYWNLALTCQLACVSFRIVFISYRAERIKQVVSATDTVSLAPPPPPFEYYVLGYGVNCRR